MKKILIGLSICVGFMFFSQAFAYVEYVMPGNPMYTPGNSVLSMPPGNYSQTCSNCYMGANNTLICVCADRRGLPHNTSLPVARNCGFVENINGQLQCTQWLRPSSQNFRRFYEVQAGPILDQVNAEQVCPMACRNGGGVWIGRWRIIVPGRMSACMCRRQG